MCSVLGANGPQLTLLEHTAKVGYEPTLPISRNATKVCFSNFGSSRNTGHVAHVCPATSSKNVNMREPTPNFRELLSEFSWITVVKLFGFIQLCVTASRCIGDDAAYALHPWVIGQNVPKVIGMRAIDHEVCCISIRFRIYMSDSLFK